jgi:hypothetical protein
VNTKTRRDCTTSGGKIIDGVPQAIWKPASASAPSLFSNPKSSCPTSICPAYTCPPIYSPWMVSISVPCPPSDSHYACTHSYGLYTPTTFPILCPVSSTLPISFPTASPIIISYPFSMISFLASVFLLSHCIVSLYHVPWIRKMESI